MTWSHKRELRTRRGWPGELLRVDTAVYAAIGLVGPRASELLNEVDLSPSGLIIREGRELDDPAFGSRS